MAYHGDLEKKAAMEQKRNLAGEESNGHEDESGIYRLRMEPIGRPKRSPTRSSKSAGHPRPSHPHPPPNPFRFIGRITIPPIFVYKPPPPFNSYRTGKTWSNANAANLSALRRSASSSQVDDSRSAAESVSETHRRHSYPKVDAPIRLRDCRQDADADSDCDSFDDDDAVDRDLRIDEYPCGPPPLPHPPPGLLNDAQDKSDAGGGGDGHAASGHAHSGQHPCTYCMDDFGLFMADHVPCPRHRINNVLNDMLLTTPFQHLLFWL